LQKKIFLTLCLLLCIIGSYSTTSVAQDGTVNPPAGQIGPPAVRPPSGQPGGQGQVGPPPDLKGTRLSPERERADFQQANDLYEKGDYDLAIFNLQEFISRYPDSTDLPKVYFMLGESYFKTQVFKSAVTFLRKVVDEYPTMPFQQQAKEDLASAYTELGDADHALGLLQQLLDNANDQTVRATLHDRIADLNLKNKDYLKAVESLLAERSLVKEGNRFSVTERIKGILDQGLKEKTLQELVLLYPRSFPGDYALIKLAQLYESQGDIYRAERELKRFLVVFPKHDYASQARSQIAEIKEKIRSHRLIIGALLPLSGKLGVFGEEVINGIQIAMDQAKDSLPENQVGVAIVDSMEQSTNPVSQLDTLVRDYSPVAIIGPLLSKDLVQLAPRVEQLQIPLISPSATASGLPNGNHYIFRNSVTNEEQGKAIAGYAVTTLGMKRFVILYPNDRYGAGLSQIFSTEVSRLGGTVLTVQTYSPDETDFGSQLKQIKEADLKGTGTLVQVEDEKDKTAEPEYIPGFDAIFLPGDAEEVALIATQLAFYDFKGITLLGANGWNSKDLIKIGGRFMEGGIFVDGFFADSSDPVVRSFVERYRARYQTDPTIFAAQAYDVTRVILAALQRGITTGPALRDSLLGVHDFAGASGHLNFMPGGEVAKKLFFIQIRNGRFVQIG
jgi:FimV-like protein